MCTSILGLIRLRRLHGKPGCSYPCTHDSNTMQVSDHQCAAVIFIFCNNKDVSATWMRHLHATVFNAYMYATVFLVFLKYFKNQDTSVHVSRTCTFCHFQFHGLVILIISFYVNFYIRVSKKVRHDDVTGNFICS